MILDGGQQDKSGQVVRWKRPAFEISQISPARIWGSMKKSYIRINIEAPVIQQRFGQMHHLLKNEQVFEVVGHFFSDELYKIWYELVQAWVTFQTSNCSVPIILIVFIE